MNLKEAFRFQNKIQELSEQAQMILSTNQNVMKTTSTVYRSKVDPEAADEVTADSNPSEYADQINEIILFAVWLLHERDKLTSAIRKAKNSADIDIDGQVSMNKERQRFAGVLRRLCNLKSSEVSLPAGGYGFRFNADGNQVKYLCDVKRVTTINYDRKIARTMYTELMQTADLLSSKIDQAMVNTEVDYEPPFDVNDSFDEILETYVPANETK